LDEGCACRADDWESETKRFGYATVTGPPLEIDKFKATYSGSKWAGSVMRIEEAKMHYLEKLRAEWTTRHLKDVERAHRRERKSAILLDEPSQGVDLCRRPTRLARLMPCITACLIARDAA